MLVKHLSSPQSAPLTRSRTPTHLFNPFNTPIPRDRLGKLLHQRSTESARKVDVARRVQPLLEVGRDPLDVGRGWGDKVDGGNVGERRAVGVQLPVGAREVG